MSAHRQITPDYASRTALVSTPFEPGIVAASLIGTTIEWYDNSSDQSYDLVFSHH
ncbi:hypothetical protein [Streptomyces sp. NPDC054783]